MKILANKITGSIFFKAVGNECDTQPKDLMKKESKKQKKIGKVMREFKGGKLKSGGRKRVKDRKQAIAIAMSESKEMMTRKKIKSALTPQFVKDKNAKPTM